MKLPKEKNTYCKACKKHTSQKISIAKKKTHGSVHTQSHGQKGRAKKRGRCRGIGNKGRYSRKAIGSRKMSGKKTSKKTDLRFTCKTCKKTSLQGKGERAKKVEFKQ